MATMEFGLIGRKVGMTQVFQDDGTMVAVSVVAIEPNTVTRLRTPERDGYTAVQLGTDVVKKLSKPETGQLEGPAQGRHHPRVPGRQRRRHHRRPDVLDRRPVRRRATSST